MNELTELVENYYSNKYLLELNNQWQSCINRISLWDDSAVSMQKNFFNENVKPFLDKNVYSLSFCTIRTKNLYFG